MVEVERGAKQDAIRAAILAFPDVTAKEIVEKVKEASKLDVSEASVAVVRGKLREEAEGKPARNGHKKPRKAKVPPQATVLIDMERLWAREFAGW